MTWRGSFYPVVGHYIQSTNDLGGGAHEYLGMYDPGSEIPRFF